MLKLITVAFAPIAHQFFFNIRETYYNGCDSELGNRTGNTTVYPSESIIDKPTARAVYHNIYQYVDQNGNPIQVQADVEPTPLVNNLGLHLLTNH